MSTPTPHLAPVPHTAPMPSPAPAPFGDSQRFGHAPEFAGSVPDVAGPAPQAATLAARGLVKRFGSVAALAGVDLAVGPGESIAVMGPSGCGKSTLLHCLAGILTPDEGSVFLDGQDLAGLSERRRTLTRRERFGFVFQFGQLLSELPADENVALPAMLLGMRRTDAVRAARAALGGLGLAGKEGRRPGELSGGEAQRVAVARALIARPSVVFADEPTGALDTATGAEVMRVLTGSCTAAGAALVVVTHDAEVARWCTRLVTMRDGRVTRS